MKKAIALFLALVMVFALCGCGKSKAVKETEQAINEIGEVSLYSGDAIKKAKNLYDFLTDSEKESVENRFVLSAAVDEYNNLLLEETQKDLLYVFTELNNAYELVETFCSDVYTAWNKGINQSDKFKGSNLNGSVKYLASQISLSYDDTLWGCTHAYITKICGEQWEGIEGHEKAKDAVATGTLFYLASNSIPAACVCSVIGAYEVNGTSENIQNTLDKAKEMLNTINAEGNLLDCYTTLGEYYDNINSFFEFLNNPTGSFDQAADTISNYKDTGRNYQSTLSRTLSN